MPLNKKSLESDIHTLALKASKEAFLAAITTTYTDEEDQFPELIAERFAEAFDKDFSKPLSTAIDKFIRTGLVVTTGTKSAHRGNIT